MPAPDVVKIAAFDWATSTYAKKPAPPLEKRQLGWTSGEQPPAGWLDWFFSQMSQWSHWVDDNFDDWLTPNSLGQRFFGSGIDGDVTVNSTITLTRDMYYRNLTVGASAQIAVNGYRIFVQDTLTLGGGLIHAHASGSVLGTGNNGSPSGATQPAVSAGGGGTYSAGGAGASGIGNGGNGAGAAGSNGTAVQYSIGGAAGVGGVGGAGSGGAGGAAGTAGALTSPVGAYLDKGNPPFFRMTSTGPQRSAGAPGGGGGGAGGGTGAAKGGGGGGVAPALAISTCVRKRLTAALLCRGRFSGLKAAAVERAVIRRLPLEVQAAGAVAGVAGQCLSVLRNLPVTPSQTLSTPAAGMAAAARAPGRDAVAAAVAEILVTSPWLMSRTLCGASALPGLPQGRTAARPAPRRQQAVRAAFVGCPYEQTSQHCRMGHRRVSTAHRAEPDPARTRLESGQRTVTTLDELVAMLDARVGARHAASA